MTNGIPLRRDIHSLFDAGYVTITPDRVFQVSEALAEEYSNGKAYYAMEGNGILVPDSLELQPDQDALAWHAETVFKG